RAAHGVHREQHGLFSAEPGTAGRESSSSTAQACSPMAGQLVRAALTLVLAVLVLATLILAVLAALVLAALILAVLAALVLAALAALATGAKVFLGTLLALLDLVAETSTRALVNGFPGALEAFVNLIGMLAGEFLRFVLKL